MKNERIIEKIQKLLALADNAGASDGEVENAMRMAHKLLAMHNLSMADIKESEKDLMTEQDMLFRNRPWARRTVNAICKLYFCALLMHMYDKRHSTRYTIIGRESNVVTAHAIAEYVVLTILKEARRTRKREGRDAAFERSFCEGASHRIVQRVFMLMKESEHETFNTGKELVVADIHKQAEADNNAYMQEKHQPKSLTRGGSSKKQNQQAFSDGHAYGDKVSLNRQMNHKGTRTGRIGHNKENK